jgi:hypothetical protein
VVGENMRKKCTTEEINYLVKICLDIANIVDRHGEKDKPYLDELGLGYRALSISLRRGMKAVIDLQDDYSKALEYQNNAEIREKSARDFLQEVFEDEYIDTIDNEDKQKIKEFVQQLMKKWEE